MDAITQLREQIDEIDGKLLSLLNKRLATCREIGRLKKMSGQSIQNNLREKQLLGKVRDFEEKNALEVGSLVRVFESILSSSRSCQKTLLK